MSKQLKGSLTLLLVSIIWGFAFVAQSEGMNSTGPFTFQGARMMLAVAILFPLSYILYTMRKKRGISQHAFMPPRLILSATVSGVILFAASALQQNGLKYTSVGHAGFLGTLYIFIVPILGMLWGKKTSLRLWVCMVAALVGMWFLCMTGEGLTIGLGDLLIIISSFFFALHIISLDISSKGYDGIQFSAVQMLVAAILHAACAFIFETPTLEGIGAAALPLAYAGIMSCGVAYTLQIIGQKHTHPTVASIIMSLEGVFAVIGGALLLAQIPTGNELIGCGLMFAATVISQLGGKKEQQK